MCFEEISLGLQLAKTNFLNEKLSSCISGNKSLEQGSEFILWFISRCFGNSELKSMIKKQRTITFACRFTWV